jgi:hypothetical protein
MEMPHLEICIIQLLPWVRVVSLIHNVWPQCFSTETKKGKVLAKCISSFHDWTGGQASHTTWGPWEEQGGALPPQEECWSDFFVTAFQNRFYLNICGNFLVFGKSHYHSCYHIFKEPIESDFALVSLYLKGHLLAQMSCVLSHSFIRREGYTV